MDYQDAIIKVSEAAKEVAKERDALKAENESLRQQCELLVTLTDEVEKLRNQLASQPPPFFPPNNGIYSVSNGLDKKGVLIVAHEEAFEKWNAQSQQLAARQGEAVAWALGNIDGTLNRLGAIYYHRQVAQAHIDGYYGELDAKLIPLYTHPANTDELVVAVEEFKNMFGGRLGSLSNIKFTLEADEERNEFELVRKSRKFNQLFNALANYRKVTS